MMRIWEESILDDNMGEIDEHIDVGVQGDVGDGVLEEWIMIGWMKGF